MTKDEHIYEQFCEDNELYHNENNSLWAIRFAKYYIENQGQSLPIKDTLIEFMDSLREYVHESRTNIAYDQRDSSEFVNIFLNERQGYEPRITNIQEIEDIVSQQKMTPSKCTIVITKLNILRSIANSSNDIQNVSGIFVVNNCGIPISYHKSKKGAEKAVEEWHNSGIEAAKKVSYDKIELSK